MLEYARSYPADRILAVFRANAGLDTRGARPPGGWETADGDSGVANRARGDGATFLDVLWERAPFTSSGQFVAAVRALAESWLAEGVFSRAERDRVIEAAVGAEMRR
ncbi:hypothetical protein ACIQ7D_03380 [Streptomyces sp. NPDC096310]|uniref:hypothetical protein n=1 Tax=Streptomyces sp. NPDC096310 TaxID=3366082 RepID=UPI00380BC6EA